MKTLIEGLKFLGILLLMAATLSILPASCVLQAKMESTDVREGMCITEKYTSVNGYKVLRITKGFAEIKNFDLYNMEYNPYSREKFMEIRKIEISYREIACPEEVTNESTK